MNYKPHRRKFLGVLATALGWLVLPARGQTSPALNGGGGGSRGGGGGGGRRRPEDYVLPESLKAFRDLSVILGRITTTSVTASAISAAATEGYYEYGTVAGNYSRKTKVIPLPAGEPVETVFDSLKPNTEYFYRLRHRKPGDEDFTARPECRFHTQRSTGSTFTFAIQGDSHPERPQMSDPELYARTLSQAATGTNDFYICMGDDFSVNTIRTVNAETVAQRYTLQRPFLGLVAQSAPVFLLNGNHEQASLFNFNQTDIRHDVAVWTQNARNRFFPTIGPDAFYSGDTHPMKAIGQLKDYYAWTWGDALFVVLDNYWQSPALVDTGFQEKGGGGGGGGGGQGGGGRGGGQGGGGQGGGRGGGGQGGGGEKGNRDWWELTIGEAQYQWFRQTLEQSKSKFKFVFAHHVMGSGRGGVDEADLYEWGGRNKRGDWEFAQKRPGWEMPIHQLMVKHGVTIFFQGHDHLYCQQELDGIAYQEVPMPGDQGYMTYNQERYQSGTKLPNSGHLSVTVSPEQVKVEYVRTFLPKDESEKHKSGEVAHSYTVAAKGAHA
jgi:hypothetical protein